MYNNQKTDIVRVYLTNDLNSVLFAENNEHSRPEVVILQKPSF